VGVIIHETESDKSSKNTNLAQHHSKNINYSQLIKEKYVESITNDNLNYLLNKPLSQENQVNKIKEALGALYFQDKMDKGTLSIEEDAYMKKHLELKAYECPKSLVQGMRLLYFLNSCLIDHFYLHFCKYPKTLHTIFLHLKLI
jgi:hypothetical protein